MRTKLKQIKKSTRKANSYYERVTRRKKLILFSEIFENSKTLNNFDVTNYQDAVNKLDVNRLRQNLNTNKKKGQWNYKKQNNNS